MRILTYGKHGLDIAIPAGVDIAIVDITDFAEIILVNSNTPFVVFFVSWRSHHVGLHKTNIVVICY